MWKRLLQLLAIGLLVFVFIHYAWPSVSKQIVKWRMLWNCRETVATRAECEREVEMLFKTGYPQGMAREEFVGGCEGKKVRIRFAGFSGQVTATKESREQVWQGKSIYLDPTPIFGNADLIKVTLGIAGPEQQLHLYFLPLAAKSIHSFTARNLERHFIVEGDDTVLADAIIKSPIKGDHITLRVPKEITLEKLCRR